MGASEADSQYLTFAMSGEDYAFRIESVREVLTVPKLTRIPRMPDFMRGVINLRGSVMPVLDLRLKFGLGETGMTADTAIIVVEITSDETDGQPLRLGVFVDAVKKVVAIPAGNIEPPPKIGLSVDTSFIQGMGRIDGRFTMILDIRKIVTDDYLAAVRDIPDIGA
jgi:purine-binding chemotaxis protein CheW